MNLLEEVKKKEYIGMSEISWPNKKNKCYAFLFIYFYF